MLETQVQFLSQEDALEKGMTITLASLPEGFHGQRSLVGYSPWDHKESDTTECIYMMEYHAALKRIRQVYRLSDKYLQEIF